MNQQLYQLLLLGLLLPGLAVAQSPDKVDMIRAEYRNSPDLPDGVAFFATLTMLDYMNNRDPESAIRFVQKGMEYEGIGYSATDEQLSQAQTMVDRLLSTFESINAEVSSENRSLGCSLGVPNAFGDQAYPILEAFEDTAEIVAANHLRSLKSDLGEREAAQLQQWLRSRKANIVHVKYNLKELYESQGISADATLARNCNLLGGEANK